jgi:hypothetical protein
MSASPVTETHRMSTLGLEREPYFENGPQTKESPGATSHSGQGRIDFPIFYDENERKPSSNAGADLPPSHSYDPYSDTPSPHDDAEMQRSDLSLVKHRANVDDEARSQRPGMYRRLNCL